MQDQNPFAQAWEKLHPRQDNTTVPTVAPTSAPTPTPVSTDSSVVQNPFAQTWQSLHPDVVQNPNGEQNAQVFPSLPKSTQGLPDSQDDLSTAENYINNPDMNQHQGYCQQFVEQVTKGHSGIYPSAIDAWDSYVQNGKAKQELKGIKPGDVIYFSPNDSNGGYGHTGIYEGNAKFVSATDNGVQSYSLSDWNQLTGQTPLGYIPYGKN